MKTIFLAILALIIGNLVAVAYIQAQPIPKYATTVVDILDQPLPKAGGVIGKLKPWASRIWDFLKRFGLRPAFFDSLSNIYQTISASFKQGLDSILKLIDLVRGAGR